MWKPKCCLSDSKTPPIDTKLNRPVDLVFRAKKTYTNSAGEQKTSYNGGEVVIRKLCFIKDRSIASQDTSITSGNIDPSTSKEMIFKNFNITISEFNEIRWEGMKLKLLGVTKLSSVVLDGDRYNAPNGSPFISIIVGTSKL